MLRSTTSAILATCLLATPLLGAEWTSDYVLGRQGLQGAYAFNFQDGLFDLKFQCSASDDMNGNVFMILNTMSDAPLYPGNETRFPVTMLFTFSNGSTATTDVFVDWAGAEIGINIWHSTFPMDKAFLEYFARAVKLELITGYNIETGLVFTYSMRGSAKAAGTLIEYCYSGTSS